jgi:predicted transcriptional regulator of viral defense system
MRALGPYLDDLLTRGRSYFCKEEAMKALGQSSDAFLAAAARLTKKRRLASPKQGFYLILRPEDQVTGVPDPVRWIDPLMRRLGLDYRVSLLRAAAFHGTSHQAAMIFQVIAPKQISMLELGRHKIQFVYQAPGAFAETNQPDWLDRMKSDAGFAKVAGVELTLLDCARYLHKAAGINGAAQITHDLGAKADPRKLAKAARAYENSAVRRLGYLLEHFGHERQANALLPLAQKAKSMKPLDPSVKPLAVLIGTGGERHERNTKWKLDLNERVEIDS